MAFKPMPDDRRSRCMRKRRYATEADALDAALLLGLERSRKAYRCPICGRWHLTSVPPRV